MKFLLRYEKSWRPLSECGEKALGNISPKTFLPLQFLQLTYFPDIYIRGYCAVMCAALIY